MAAARATAALRTTPDAWSARPVLVYGFDDLTVEQLELLSALAEASEVTVSVAYEDRDALVARAHLYQELRERGGESEPPLEPNPANTAEPDAVSSSSAACCASGRDRIEPDDGLVRMEAAGERGQAEQIGGEIARLLADGVKPDEIAVVLRSPDRHGPLYESVLAGFGVPVAVEARVPADPHGGRARADRAAARGADLAGAPRTCSPSCARRGSPSRATRTGSSARCAGGACETAAEALEAWSGRPLFEFDELAKRRQPDELLRVVAGLARRIGERPHERRAPLAARAGAPRAARCQRSRPRPSRPWPRCPASKTPPAEALATLEAPRGAAVARTDRGARSSDQPVPDSRSARHPPVRRLAAGGRVPPPRRRRAVPFRRAARRARTAAAGQG